MKTIKNNFINLGLVLFVISFFNSSHSFAQQTSAAQKAADLKLNYNYDHNKSENLAEVKPQKEQKKNSISQLGSVSEEKTTATATSQGRMLFNPYHRTVGTGISF